MRKRIAGGRETISQQSIDRALAYTTGNRSISEVILWGEDPLMLDDDELAAILEALRGIDPVGVIRKPHFMIDLPGGGGKVELLPKALS